MRHLVLLTLALLTACGGRYIDRDAGVGPQGGPGYKQTDPPSGPASHYVRYLVYPDHFSRPSDQWRFRISARIDNNDDEMPFYVDLTTQNVYEDGSSWIFGSAECLSSRPFASCLDLRLNLQLLAAIQFEVHRKINCRITGRFEGEAASNVWAIGTLTSIDHLDSTEDDVWLAKRPPVFELETSNVYAPSTIQEESVEIEVEQNAESFLMKMRMPTQAGDGAIIDYQEISPVAFQETTPGHYQGILNFKKAGRLLPAHVDLGCDL